MNPQDPLAGLHPLREPALVGWWPPAPGWWILLGVGLLALAALAWYALRRHRANAYRRRALAQLEAIYAEYQRTGDRARCLQAVNALLKSVALHAYPRRRVAAASGAGWLAFLNDTARGRIRFEPAYSEALYRPGGETPDPEALRRTAATWIARHEVAA